MPKKRITNIWGITRHSCLHFGWVLPVGRAMEETDNV